MEHAEGAADQRGTAGQRVVDPGRIACWNRRLGSNRRTATNTALPDMVEPCLTVNIRKLDFRDRGQLESELTERNLDSEPLTAGRNRSEIDVLVADQVLTEICGPVAGGRRV